MRIGKLRRVAVGAGIVLLAVAAGSTIAISQIDLGDYRDSVTAQLGKAAGRNVVVAGDMDLDFGISPRVTLGRLRVANPDWAKDAHMLEAESVRAEIALLPLLWGTLRLSEIEVESPILNLERASAGRVNWSLGPSDADSGRRNPLTDLSGVEVRDAVVRYRADGADAVQTLKIDALTAKDVGGDRMRTTGSAVFRGMKLNLKGEIGAPSFLLAAGHHYPLDVTLATSGSKLGIKGTIIDPPGDRRLDLQITLETDDPDRLAEPLPLPDDVPDVPIRLTTRLTGTGGRYALREIDLQSGDSRVRGRSVLDFRSDRPLISGDLTASTFDLHRFFGAGDARPAKSGRVFGKKPLPWPLLQRVNADVRIEVGAFRILRTLTATDVRSRVALQDGRLHLRKLTARIGTGTVEMTGHADGGKTPPEIAVQGRALGLDYGRILDEAAITDAVTGTARVEFDLSSEGRSPYDMAAAAQGRVAVVGEDGRVSNDLLARAGSGLAKLLAPWRKKDGDLRLNCAVARFDIAKGRMTSRAMLADTRIATLGGEGQIRLAEERYDLRLVPNAKQTSLISLAVPVRITGPLQEPRIAPDPLGTAKAGAIAIGTVLNPLVTLGALVLESETADANPCVAALNKAAAKKGSAEAGGNGNSERASGAKGFFNNLSKSIDKALDATQADDQDSGTLLQKGR